MVISHIFVPTKYYHEHGMSISGLDVNLLSNVYQLSIQLLTETDTDSDHGRSSSKQEYDLFLWHRSLAV